MPEKASVAIVGSGNTSVPTCCKLLRSDWLAALDDRHRSGVRGPARACKLGLETSHEGGLAAGAVGEAGPGLRGHQRLRAGRRAAVREARNPRHRLTPAAVGPGVIRRPTLRALGCAQRQHGHLRRPGHDGWMPCRVVDVPHAEIVASVSSASAGPGQANIDEFTKTTSAGVGSSGGAKRGKAIIILNPADPPMIMRDTIFCAIPGDADRDAITQSIKDVVAEVQTY